MSYHLKREFLEKWMSVLNRDSDDPEMDEKVGSNTMSEYIFHYECFV